MEYSTLVDGYIQKEIEVLRALDQPSICKALEVLVDALETEKNIYIFGNGGSSTMCPP